MIRKLGLLVAVCGAVFAASSANAQTAMRAWVSGHGADAAGCGSPINPCRSLQYAHDSIVATGGEIDILDPAGYGAIAITKSISIINDGVGVAGVQQSIAGQDAITIAAGATGAVTLRGLTIDGLGVAQDGIELTGASTLTVIDCTIRHFTEDGVYLKGHQSLTLAILNTLSADNGDNGFDVSPTGNGGAHGVLDHTYALNNGDYGIKVSGAGLTGANQLFVTVSNSIISNNGASGFLSDSPGSTRNTFVQVRSDFSDNNFGDGYEIEDWSEMTLSTSEASNDGFFGVFIGSNAGGFSYGDNALPSLNPVSGSLQPIALR